MLVVSFLLLVREIKRLKGLGECLLFERNEVEHYKETFLLWSGAAIKPGIISVHFEITSKILAFTHYMIEAI